MILKRIQSKRKILLKSQKQKMQSSVMEVLSSNNNSHRIDINISEQDLNMQDKDYHQRMVNSTRVAIIISQMVEVIRANYCHQHIQMRI